MISNPTPKQRFLEKGEFLSQHRAMVDRESFDRAVDTALLEYQRGMCAPTQDAINPAANFYRILGAQEFAVIMRNLSETATPPSRLVTEALNHKA